jgi:hypothetical protein
LADPLSTEELMERLERRQCGPEGQGHSSYLFKEVQIGDRRADAVSVGLWNSRGHKIEGFEVKTNRRDWVSEMEDHGKAEPAMAICDHFWLVTNPGVLLPGELPYKWGLLVSAGRRRHLRVEKPAPALHEEQPEITRHLLAKFIRHAASLRWERENEIREKVRETERERVGSGEDVRMLKNRAKIAEDGYQQLQDAYEAFKRAAGFDFLTWRPEAEEMRVLGAAARAVRSGPAALRSLLADVKRHEERAVQHRKQLKDVRTELQEALDDYA